MALHFKPWRYCIGLWYFDVPPELHPPLGGNWMGAVWRDPDFPPNKWRMQYRHRYYCGEDINTETLLKSQDRFHWYNLDAIGTEAELEEKVTVLFTKLAHYAGQELQFLEIRGGSEKLAKISMSGNVPRWFNMVSIRTEPEPE